MRTDAAVAPATVKSAAWAAVTLSRRYSAVPVLPTAPTSAANVYAAVRVQGLINLTAPLSGNNISLRCRR